MSEDDRDAAEAWQQQQEQQQREQIRMDSTPNVYTAIAAVQADMARQGIGKDRTNVQQGYKFRGIDDVYNALAPVLAQHKLCILPRCVSRDVVERVNAKGTALFYVTVQVAFDFVSAADGSRHTIITYGEAMDTGDKATNKAMSAAYKYAAMQAFAIPTEGDNDADASTHEVVASARPAAPAVNMADKYPDVIPDVKRAKTVEALNEIWRALSEPARAELKKTFAERRQAIETSMLNA